MLFRSHDEIWSIPDEQICILCIPVKVSQENKTLRHDVTSFALLVGKVCVCELFQYCAHLSCLLCLGGIAPATFRVQVNIYFRRCDVVSLLGRCDAG